MIAKIKDYCVDKDQVVTQSALQLHYEKDKRQKTLLGGLITICIKVAVICIGIE